MQPGKPMNVVLQNTVSDQGKGGQLTWGNTLPWSLVNVALPLLVFAVSYMVWSVFRSNQPGGNRK